MFFQEGILSLKRGRTTDHLELKSRMPLVSATKKKGMRKTSDMAPMERESTRRLILKSKEHENDDSKLIR